MKTTNALIIITNIVIISLFFIHLDEWKQVTNSNQATWTQEVSTRLEQIEKRLSESNTEIINTSQGIKGLQSFLSQDSTLEYHTVYTDRESDDVGSLEREFNALGKLGWKYMGYCMNDGTNGRVVLFSRKGK